jgi:protein involved in polysaccharide export with SLBB domain
MSFCFTMSGEEIPLFEKEERCEGGLYLGWGLEGVAKPLPDGRVQLDLTLSNTNVANRSEEQVRLGVQSTRTIVRAKLDEVARFPLEGLADGQHIWAQFVVREHDLDPDDEKRGGEEQPTSRPAGRSSSENIRPANIQRRPFPGAEARTPVAAPSPPNTSRMEKPEPLDETQMATERYKALSESLAKLAVERIQYKVKMENLPDTASELLAKYPEYRAMLEQDPEVANARERLWLAQIHLKEVKERNSNADDVKRATQALEEAYAKYNAITNKRKTEILEYATSSAKSVYENALSAENQFRKILEDLEKQMALSVQKNREEQEGAPRDQSSTGTGVVYVLGDVKRPGAYAHDGKLTLLKLFAATGGSTSDHAGLVRIREQLGDGREAITLFSVKKILNGESPDFVLREGDVLHFDGGTIPKEEASKREGVVKMPASELEVQSDPEKRRRGGTERPKANGAGSPKAKGFVYISGDVARPGTYLLPEDSSLTLLKLLASAGGATSGEDIWVQLHRREPNGNESFSYYNLKLIHDAHEPDFTLQPNDVLTVGVPEPEAVPYEPPVPDETGP